MTLFLSNSSPFDAPAAPQPEPAFEPEPEHSLVAQAAPSILTLQVCNRRFTTTAASLTSESRYFSSLLSTNWRNRNSRQADGSYFIDADPDLFAHILRYLRHGQLPIFYSNSTGHDWGLYAALLGEARYFQIDRLVKWLESQRYLDAVKVRRVAIQLEGVGALDETTPANQENEYHPSHRTKQIYVCPRRIPSHRGNFDACGKLCHRARGDEDVEYEEVMVLNTLVVKKTLVVNYDLCNEG